MVIIAIKAIEKVTFKLVLWRRVVTRDERAGSLRSFIGIG
jgi:hypothetical protein